MSRRPTARWRTPAAFAAATCALGVAAALTLRFQERVVSAAASPDGSWRVAVLGRPRLRGGYELVVEVRDGGGAPAPAGGSFVVGLTRDLAAAEGEYAVRFLNDTTAVLGGRRTLDRSRYFPD